MSDHEQDPRHIEASSMFEIASARIVDPALPAAPLLSELVYHYDPAPAGPLPEPGVTQGYVVMWSGVAGPARIAEATMLTDPDGGFTLTARDGGDVLEFTDCAVVDDGENREQ